MGRAGLHVVWKDLTFDVNVGTKEEKRVLHGITGQAGPGGVLGIMGPSGCGKTSLINVLGSRTYDGTEGELTVNGVSARDGGFGERVRKARKATGYVAQEDTLVPSLTVSETLSLAAYLRIAAKSKRVTAVEKAVKEFDLTSCYNTTLGNPMQRGGISGGERRRLSMACETLTDPALLLLDEPTSGLDATTALVVVQLLRDRADNLESQTTVVLSIHQPRGAIMPLLSSIMLLAQGRVVYAGPTWLKNADGTLSEDGVLGYLTRVGQPCPPYESPADYLLDLVNTRVDGADEEEDAKKASNDVEAVTNGQVETRAEVVKRLSTTWLQSDEAKAFMQKPANAPTDNNVALGDASGGGFVDWCRRTIAIFLRILLYKVREPMAAATQFTNSIMLPLFFGAIYWQMGYEVKDIGDRVSAISLVVLMQAFMAFDQLMLFPKERAIYLHETASGLYSTSMFYWARSLADGILHVIFAFGCAAITYEMFGLRNDDTARFNYYMLVIFATLAGAALLTIIGAACKDMDQSMGGSSILLLFMLVDGNWVNKNNIPDWLGWLETISFMAYGVNGAVTNEFKPEMVFKCSPADAAAGCTERTGLEVLVELGMEKVDVNECIEILIWITVASKLIAMLLLHFCWTGQPFSERWRRLVYG